MIDNHKNRTAKSGCATKTCSELIFSATCEVWANNYYSCHSASIPSLRKPFLSSYNIGVAIPLRALPLAVNPRTTGVILAIDYGKKRLGLALSDEFCVTSRPYATWTRINRRRDLARLRELVRQQGVQRIVVGLPLHLDGTPSEMSEEAKSFAARVEKALGLPVEMMDERLSSWEAHQTVSNVSSSKRARRGSSGHTQKKKKTPLDEIAAAIILRDYLDRARTGSRA
jgi:putative Holliday junction resolvase